MLKPNETKTNDRAPYRAVICGEEYIVRGWRNGHLLTDKGEFVFRRLQNKQVESEWPGELGKVAGNYPIESTRLLEVAMLQFNGNGGWLLNGINLWPFLQFQPAGSRLSEITSSEVLRVHKGEIHAVAWVQAVSYGSITSQLDTVLADWKKARESGTTSSTFAARADWLNNHYLSLFAGWSKPIWLTEFHKVGADKNSWMSGLSDLLNNPKPVNRDLYTREELAEMLNKGVNPWLAGLENLPPPPSSPAVEIVNQKKPKPASKSRARRVARFENDFFVAVIPQQGRKDMCLTVEPELRKLVKAIIDAGGRIPRTKLRVGKSDSWRPEKLLESTAAKMLMDNGLIGKDSVGRTVTYWAKQAES